MRAKYLSTLILVFTLLLTVCTGSVGWAQAIDFSKPYARMGVVGMGAGVAAAACSSTWQTATENAAASLSWVNDTYFGAAYSFTAAATGTVYHVIVKLRRVGTGGGGNVTLELCTNNATPNPDAPSATCTAADATVAAADCATGGGEKTFDFAAGYAVTASTRYWIVLTSSGDGDASNLLQIYYNGTGTEIVLRDTDDSRTWGTQDATGIGYHTLSNCE